MATTASASRPACADVARAHGEHLGRAERGEGHRPRRRRPLLEPALERRHRALAHPVVAAPVRAAVPNAHIARPQQSSTPRRSCHRPSGGAPVAHLAVDALGVDEEPVGEPGEIDDGGVVPRLAARGHEHPGHVVGAVAVPDPWLGELGVLERADRVAHRDDVVEARFRARSRPDPRGDEQRRRQVVVAAGDGRPRQLRRQPPALGGHRLEALRVGDEVAHGVGERPASRWGTTIPAPPLSSSTACGNAVATTGRPEATASTRTPEVTWSSESYGSTTRSAAPINRVSAGRSRYESSNDTSIGRAGPPAPPHRASPGTPRRPLRRTFGCVAPATRYDGRGRTSPSSAIASMAHSMPLPGPRSPHVNRRRPSPGARPHGRIGVRVGRWRRRAVRDHRHASPGRRRSPRSVAGVATSVITTTASAASQMPSSTRRWWAVGWRTTVWATTIDGTTSGVEDVEHVGAVDAAVDAVLVLHDGDVDAVRARRPRRAIRRGRPAPGDATTSGSSTSSARAAAHDVDGRAVGDQPGGQGRGERGDAARRRRERRQDPERTNARRRRHCPRGDDLRTTSS